MASTFSLTSASYEGRYLQLTCTQVKNVSANKSTINWTLKATGGSSKYYDTGPTTVTINGSRVYYCARKAWNSYAFPAAAGSTSGSIEVSHDDNGNKSIFVSMSTAIYTSTVSTKNGTWALDSIARKAEVTSATDFTDVGNPTINYKNPGGFKINARLEFAGKAIRRDNISNTGSYTFALTSDEMNLLRNSSASNKMTVREVIGTCIGSNSETHWSWLDKTFTITENSNTKPTVTMSVSLNNTGLPDSFGGIYIQGKSKVNVTLSGVGKYNASIQSYSASINGKTYNSQSFTSDVIANSGTVDIIGFAKDNRGFTGSVTKQISVTPYSKPLVIPLSSENAIMCYRSDGNGTRVGSSTSVWIKAKLSFSPVESEGVNKNSCLLQWRRKLSGDAWNDSVHTWSNLISSSNGSNEYNAILTGAIFNVKQAYTVQVRAADTLGEPDVKTFDIPTQDVALHLGKGGKNVSVGTYCDYSEDYTFYSDWKAVFDKGISVSGASVTDFVVEQGTTGIWTYRKWNSGITECWGTASVSVLCKNQSGSCWFTDDLTIALPTGLFTENGVVNLNCHDYWCWIAKAHMSQAENVNFRIARGSDYQTVFTTSVDISARGRWK